MKFSCQSSDLVRKLAIVEKAISSRSTIQVLESVFFELTGSQLVLRGHDLELGIETVLNVQGEQDGRVLLKAKMLMGIVSKCPNQVLHFESTGSFVRISSDSQVDFSVLCSPVDEYPAFPAVADGVTVSLQNVEMRQLIHGTLFAVSNDETKHFLNGILVRSEANKLVCVSTDGFRLALCRYQQESELAPFSVIIPFKAMSECLKVLQQSEDAGVFSLVISENQVSFRVGDVLFVSRVIQGQFPDYNQVLPKETLHGYVVSRRALLDAAERATIIAGASNHVVRVGFSEGKLGIYANASIGDFKEFITASRQSGEGEIKVAFNVKLVLDSLRTIQSDDIRIAFNNELAPCLFCPVSDEDSVHVIMPIRTSDYHAQSSEPVAVEAHV